MHKATQNVEIGVV